MFGCVCEGVGLCCVFPVVGQFIFTFHRPHVLGLFGPKTSGLANFFGSFKIGKREPPAAGCVLQTGRSRVQLPARGLDFLTFQDSTSGTTTAGEKFQIFQTSELML